MPKRPFAKNTLKLSTLTKVNQQMTNSFLHNLLLFGRLLHQLGLDVTTNRMMEVVQALPHISLGQQTDFYYTLRTMLVRRQEDLPRFDAAFAIFWRKPEYASAVQLYQNALQPRPMNAQTVIVAPQLNPTVLEDEEADEDAPTLLEITQTYSQQEILRFKDFGEMSESELTAVKQLITQMVWQLKERKTRRKQLGKGETFDFRRAFRQNLRYGGEMVQRPSKTNKTKPRPLILIADISGSMEQYTRLLIQFLYSVARGLDQPVESFVFGTRLTRITRQLKSKNVAQALTQVSHEVQDWSGGTRIGDSLKTFNFEWSRRMLRRGAVVLLISDGWDRGDPNLLHKEMARLHRMCYRLIWLNPLLGMTNYEPLTRGMQAALPHIDDFLPVHNLNSLEALADHLAQLGERRVKKRPFPNAAFIRQH